MALLLLLGSCAEPAPVRPANPPPSAPSEKPAPRDTAQDHFTVDFPVPPITGSQIFASAEGASEMHEWGVSKGNVSYGAFSMSVPPHRLRLTCDELFAALRDDLAKRLSTLSIAGDAEIFVQGHRGRELTFVGKRSFMRARVVAMSVGTEIRMVMVFALADQVKAEPSELHEFVESLKLQPPPFRDAPAGAERPELDVLVRDSNGAKCY